MKKTKKLPTYLTQFPISIREKKHSKTNRYNGEQMHFKEESSRRFTSHYGYFAVDKANNINCIISLVDLKSQKTYTIKIAKQHLYDSLMVYLMYRPIKRIKERTKHFYARNNIETLIPFKEMNNLTPEEIKERYLAVKEQLGGYIKESKGTKPQRLAELQLERLIEQQWKMELLYEIYSSERLLNKESSEV